MSCPSVHFNAHANLEILTERPQNGSTCLDYQWRSSPASSPSPSPKTDLALPQTPLRYRKFGLKSTIEFSINVSCFTNKERCTSIGSLRDGSNWSTVVRRQLPASTLRVKEAGSSSLSKHLPWLSCSPLLPSSDLSQSTRQRSPLKCSRFHRLAVRYLSRLACNNSV